MYKYEWGRGVADKHADSQHRGCQSIPPCVAFKTPLVRKATGNHFMNSTTLEKTQSPVSGFCYVQNRVCNAVSINMNIEKQDMDVYRNKCTNNTNMYSMI